MSSTRKLFKILLVLIFFFGSYLLFSNYESVTKYVVSTINKFSKKEVQIPLYSKNKRYYSFKTVSETDNFYPNNIDDIKKIYYTVLNNGWDSFTFYCNDGYETCIEDVRTVSNSNNDKYISIINNYVSPFNSYQKYNTLIVNNNEVNLTIEKLYLDTEIDQINTIVNKFIEDNKINTQAPQKSDIIKIHDYLIKNIKYDDNYDKKNKITDSNKATGALLKGVALCSGYSDTFAIFLDKLNIPNFKINSKEHEWNVVYFDNKWSHVDVTWDDDEINKNNTKNFFMINTNELLKKDKKEHNFNESLFLELK